MIVVDWIDEGTEGSRQQRTNDNLKNIKTKNTGKNGSIRILH
jgi:hypothetical protein